MKIIYFKCLNIKPLKVKSNAKFDEKFTEFSISICSNHILPICLPTTNIDLTGRKGLIAGWGKTDLSSGHTGTAILQTASVPIISKLSGTNTLTFLKFQLYL